MIESTIIANGFMKLTATTGLIHKIGTDNYAKSVIMLPGEVVDMYEEVTEHPTCFKEQYRAEVERLIAERYTCGQEIQLLAEKDADPEAYNAYRQFVDQCKLTARENLSSLQN